MDSNGNGAIEVNVIIIMLLKKPEKTADILWHQHSFPAKWHLMLQYAMTNQRHYPDPGSDTSSVWNFCPLALETIFHEETSGGVMKCQLFSQPNVQWQCCDKNLSYFEVFTTSYNMFWGVRQLKHWVTASVVEILWLSNRRISTFTSTKAPG